jgi:hypothetical protein
MINKGEGIMSKTKGSLVFLPRGGILISTSAGNIQLGIPPETIKDTMKLEGGVPGTFIIPQSMFDLHCGIAPAEMEFPVYYNFNLTVIRHLCIF